MPRFMQTKTAKKADVIFLTKSEKALGVKIGTDIKFYPANRYNLAVCAEAKATIKGMRRNA